MPMIDREKIKSAFPFLTRFIHWIKRRKNELSALPRHLRRRRAQKKNPQLNHGIIKVVFLCQYIPAWSKNKQLYEALRSDERFDVTLLCVPNRISANQLQNPEDLSNDTYEYFSSHGYKEAVNALIGKNEWLDLKAQHPDYVICNRYDRPMPIPYTSSELSEYVKICLIIYGTALLRVEETMIDKTFASNTFYFFAESEGIRTEFLRRNRLLQTLKLSDAVFCGIPAVENALKAKGEEARSWDFTSNSFRVLYTPRWTMDPTWGGSTFLKYKQFFLTYADENPDSAVLVRPHPLMFDHFVNSGIITSAEVEAYFDACNKRINIRVDKEKEYLASFWNSSVLVCDYSSMIIEFFAMGKPIIYLTYDEKIDYTEQMQEMLHASYIVSDESQLKEILGNLKSGYDPLQSKRAEVCSTEITCGNNSCASENMKEVLITGYRM